ncbi:hypothetical protein K3495_g4764 [Podosphaera aphanis]|nr:hypothetical protein K3495_g4764 [Podosphaera aphanis]
MKTNRQQVQRAPAEQRIYPQRQRQRQPPATYRQFLADITVFLANPVKTNAPKPNFEDPRRKELNGLLESDVFEIVQRKDIPLGTRIFGSCFVDTIKHEGTPNAFEKSRLVVQAYGDTDKKQILTQAQTIQRVSQRLILCIAQIFPIYEIYVRDISQAYTQSQTQLVRKIFINAPSEMGLDHESILRDRLPLHGVPEAGTH